MPVVDLRWLPVPQGPGSQAVTLWDLIALWDLIVAPAHAPAPPPPPPPPARPPPPPPPPPPPHGSDPDSLEGEHARAWVVVTRG
jgi:hypothetical protein